MTKIYRSFSTPGIRGRKIVLAIGSFNGLHRGHLSVINNVVELAASIGNDVTSALLSFHPHPSVVLGRAERSLRLISLREKISRLDSLGIDALTILRFTKSTASLTAEEFLESFIFSHCDLKGVVLGPDSAIGRGREANVDKLIEIFGRRGVRAQVVPELSDGPDRIRSRTLSSMVGLGDLEGARHLLGREYSLVGRVVRGDGRGRTIGYPTANINLLETVLPPLGVYAARVTVSNVQFPAVVNIGIRPTFGGDKMKVEAHLLGFDGDLYGSIVSIELVQRIRAEIRFGSISALVEQISIDCKEALEILGVSDD